MITYLMEGYGFELVTGSNILFAWTAASELATVMVAFLADSYVGRFQMIGFGSVISLLGMFLLWSTTIIPGARPCSESSTSECTSWNFFQIVLLLSSFGLMSIGAVGPSLLAFGAEQLVKKDNPDNASIIAKFLNWYYITSWIAVVFGMTFVVYIQDHFGWLIGYGVPVILSVLSALSFFLGSRSYIKAKVKGRSVIPIGYVLMASWRKRHLNIAEARNQTYHCGKESTLTAPSDKLRFFNKACIVEDATEEVSMDGIVFNPWSLCTVDQVEEVKALIKVIPMWSAGIMSAVTVSQSSFLRMQAGSIDRHVTSNFEISAGSFSSLGMILNILCLILYDQAIIPLASRITGKPFRLSIKKRMAIGLLFGFLSMVTEAVVEGVRRKIAIDEGFADDPKAVVHMSALWLLPYYFVSGMASVFFGVGQMQFFYTEFPKSMSSLATSFQFLNLSVANLVSSLIMSSIDSITSKGGKESWVSSNINKAHFDYFFWVLAGLCLLNFFYYLMCSKAYGPTQD